MNLPPETADWLMEGDPAVRWQVLRDVLGAPEEVWQPEQARVEAEGWGAALLALQAADGSWGGGLYGPKWTSTFYTLRLLRELGLPGDNPAGGKAAALLLDSGFRPADGGMGFSSTVRPSETCGTGMGLALLSLFAAEDERIHTIALHLLREQLPDGGWNCQKWRGATHSSFHTTIAALEGLHEYLGRWGPNDEIMAALGRGREFLLAHRLFRSHTSGNVVSEVMTRFHFPVQWHYDVLRGLDHFRAADASHDERLADALALVRSRQRKDGRWWTASLYAGLLHFALEPAGSPGRMVTFRCLRVLRWWEG